MTDPSGAVIANARITITNQDTGVKISTVSNGTGEYVAPYILPGRYSISAAAPGFQQYTRNDITVQAGDKLGVDLPMTVAPTVPINHRDGGCHSAADGVFDSGRSAGAD